MSSLSLIGTVLSAIFLVNGKAANQKIADAENWEEVARLHRFAAEVTDAVESAPALPFKGRFAKEKTGVALVAIAIHESRLRPEVIDCRVKGDAGRAMSAFQLQKWARGAFTEEEVCSSVKTSALRATDVLVIHGAQCSKGGPLAMFQGYATGRCGTAARIIVGTGPTLRVLDADGGKTRCKTWEKTARTLGLPIGAGEGC